MTTDIAIGLFRETLLSALVLAAPMLLAGLVVGLAVSIFQAATQIHEMTVSFVPKVLVVALVFIVFLPWMARYILEFSANLFGNLSGYGR